MRPPDLLLKWPSLLLLASLIQDAGAEICPLENPTEGPATAVEAGSPVKRLILKPKSCPDFKDDTDQSHCCPSRITFGSYYCCTLAQKHEIQSEIAAERRRQFVKKYLAVIIIGTITASVLGIVVASIICKRVSFCPLHHSKGAYSHSNTSFQVPSSHSTVGGSRYQPVARHSGTFTNLNSTPPQASKLISYDAPPPYESRDSYRALGEQPAQVQHQLNRIMENQLNSLIQSNEPSLATTTQRTSGEFVIIPPPAQTDFVADTLNTVD